MTYSFGIIGAFWGAAYAVEEHCGDWWKGNKIIKFIIVLLSSLLYLWVFSNICII